MHESHWGLQESPFGGNADPKHFHCSPTHEEALARLQFLVEQRRRLGLLLGGSGSGKSLLLKVFRQKLRRRGIEAAILNPLGHDAQEFLWSLAAALKSNPGTDDSRLTLWRRISDRLAENRYQELQTIILLDDADRSDGEVLTQIQRLLLFDQSPEARLTVVLAADGQRQEWLGPRLLDLAELRIELEPWQTDDTSDFLRASMAQMGGRNDAFSKTASARLHELTSGIPRRVSQLAELTLLAGASQNAERIDEEMVERVHSELTLSRAAND